MFGNSLTHRLEIGDGVKQKNEDKNKSREIICFVKKKWLISLFHHKNGSLFVDVELKKQH